MKDRSIRNEDGTSSTNPFAGRTQEGIERHSDVTGNLNHDVDYDDDDSFIFTDHLHQRQEFEQFSAKLTELGLMNVEYNVKIEKHGIELEKEEKAPLLHRRDAKVKEDTSKTKTYGINEKPDESFPYRRESQINAYRHGEKELFLKVLDQVDKIQSSTRKDKGFKEWKFTFGLLNCLLIAYVFGSYPEHFWILYAFETIFWMSYKFRGMCLAKPLSEALYYLDFCWVMNTLGVAIIISLIFFDSLWNSDTISIEVRKNIFLACFGVFCGPVFMAAMTLPFVAFLFHDVNTMANLIIHVMPSMVMYHYRWHAAKISTAYPTIFPTLVQLTEKLNNGNSMGSVTLITLATYFAWFIPYVSWMLLLGLKLPVVPKEKGKPLPKYDTVFHSTWKDGLCQLVGTVVWKRPKEISRDCMERNDYEVRDFLLYMVGHALGSCGIGIMLLGDTLCFHGGKTVHATLIWFATIVCAKRGADRYTYYVTSMYGQKLRKAFRELEQQELDDVATIRGNH